MRVCRVSEQFAIGFMFHRWTSLVCLCAGFGRSVLIRDKAVRCLDAMRRSEQVSCRTSFVTVRASALQVNVKPSFRWGRTNTNVIHSTWQRLVARKGLNQMKVTATARPSCFHFLSVAMAVMAAAICSPARAAAGNETSSFLPADRATTWNPGMMAVGGIPARSTVCATLSPNSPARDDTVRIQAAINVCPIGQVVQLTAGTFLINSGNYLVINKGITLRGAGPDRTTLAKTDGAKPFQSEVGAKPSPLILVGPSLFSSTDNVSGAHGSTNLTADAVKGTYAVKVSDIAGFRPGQIVLLDEASGAEWLSDPQGRGQIWASSDGRVVWNKAKPTVQYVDDFAPNP